MRCSAWAASPRCRRSMPGHKLGLKTFIHDSNARPGRANVLTSRFCTQVFLGLDAAKAFFPKRETVITGTPVRPEIINLPSREEAADLFGLDPDKTTILVTGGSQGARRLNELSAAGRRETCRRKPRCCTSPERWISSGFPKSPTVAPATRCSGFCDQMPSAYAARGSGHRAVRRIQPHGDRDLRPSVDSGAVSLRRGRPPDAQRRGFRRRRSRQARPGTRSRCGKTRLFGNFHPPRLANLQAHGKSRPRTRHPGRRGAGVRRHRSHSPAIMTDLSQRLTDRSKPLHIHLIGVAGSGMSGLALLLLGMGHKVSGSDRVTTAETERMQGVGLVFSSPHTAEAVKGADIVVFSSAIRPENPAYAAARRSEDPAATAAPNASPPSSTRARASSFPAPTGKPPPPSMTAHVLREAGQKPSHYVGAEIPILGANAKWSEEGEFMVAEGDESDGTLALYRPGARGDPQHRGRAPRFLSGHRPHPRGLHHARRPDHAASSSIARRIPSPSNSAPAAKTRFPTAGRTPTTPPPTSAISKDRPRSP